MILADSSAWIDHLRAGNLQMAEWLDLGEVLMHPFVLGELACGNLKNRPQLLRDFSRLPFAAVAANSEVLQFIERYSLMGKGVGYIDVHLLASTAITDGARIWSRDKRLMSIAEKLDLAFDAG